MRLVNFIKNNKDNAGLVFNNKVFSVEDLNKELGKNWSLTFMFL
jgi:hypothetical protein